jgi:hypothetical protein
MVQVIGQWETIKKKWGIMGLYASMNMLKASCTPYLSIFRKENVSATGCQSIIFFQILTYKNIMFI